jgi:hypothetical protein
MRIFKHTIMEEDIKWWCAITTLKQAVNRADQAIIKAESMLVLDGLEGFSHRVDKLSSRQVHVRSRYTNVV